MMQPDELVAILEGTNTAVVADDEYSAATFFVILSPEIWQERPFSWFILK